MDIDLGEELVFNVKYQGKEYKLREPTAQEVGSFQKKAKRAEDSDVDGEDSVSVVMGFLCSLGLDKDVCSNLGVTKLNKLVEAIVGELSKKK